MSTNKTTIKKRNGFLAIALAISLGLTALAPSTEASTQTVTVKLFNDVSAKHTYATEIYTMKDKNIITGYEDNTFRPSETITRKHAAALIYRAVQSEKLTASKATQTFKKPSDILSTSTYYNAIKYLMERGLLKADSKNNINLNQALTRGEMANILATVFDLEKKATYTFTDTIGTAYDVAVQKLYANGITTGYDDNTFKPNNTLTRAHYTVFMYRALNVDENYKAKPIESAPTANTNISSNTATGNTTTTKPVEQKPAQTTPPKGKVNTEPVKIGHQLYVPANHVNVDTSKHNPTFTKTVAEIKSGKMKPTTNTKNLDIQPVDLEDPTLGLPLNYVQDGSTIKAQIKKHNLSKAQQEKNLQTALQIHKERKFSVQRTATLNMKNSVIAKNVQLIAGDVGVSVNQYVASYKYVLNTGNMYDGGTYVLYIYNDSINMVANMPINFDFEIFEPNKLK